MRPLTCGSTICHLILNSQFLILVFQLPRLLFLTPHSTGQSPFDRFASHMECIRPAPSNLKDYFRKAALRRVGKDRTITLNGRLYEAPVPLIGKRVTLLFHEKQAENIEIIFEHKSYGMAVPVNLHVNCKIRRDHNSDAEIVGKDHKPKGGSLWPNERSWDQ